MACAGRHVGSTKMAASNPSSFDTKGATKQWLDTEITAKLATGTYALPPAPVCSP